MYNKFISSNVNKSLISVGSFWSEHVNNRKIPTALVGLCYKTRLYDQVDTVLKQLLNYRDFKVNNIYHTFSPEEIIFTGSEGFSEEFRFDESVLPNRFDQGSRNLWLVKLTPIAVDTGLHTNVREQILPLRIKAADGNDLILNSDFFLCGDYLGFYMDPRVIFIDNKFLTAYGVRDPKNIYSFPLAVEAVGRTKHLKNFARVSQSPKNFKLALCEIAGLNSLDYTQKLISKNKYDDTTVYTFEKEVIKINGKHEELSEGFVYKEGYIIGEGIKFFTPKAGEWWKDIDFDGGMCLSSIVGRPGIGLSSDLVLAYGADAESDSVLGSKLHVRLDLKGHPDVVDAYWDEVEARERTTGKYLNDIIGIGKGDATFVDANFAGIFDRLKDKTKKYNQLQSRNNWHSKEYRNIRNLRDNAMIDPTDPLAEHTPALKYVNGIDVYFRAILGQVATVIFVDLVQVRRNMSKLVRFINKEQPAGSCVLLIIKCPDEEEEINLNQRVEQSFSAASITQSTAADSTALSGIIVDSYTARIDT